MENNQEHVIQLILKEINGTVCDDDRIYLYDLVANDDEVFQVYMKMHAELDSEEVRRGMEDMSGTMKSFFIKQIQNRWLLVVCLLSFKICLFGGCIWHYKSQYIEKQLELVRLKAKLNPPPTFTLK